MAKSFSSALLQWFERHGRKTLPWQNGLQDNIAPVLGQRLLPAQTGPRYAAELASVSAAPAQEQYYRVWVSEIMLQQTQVKTVIPYFKRFMARFPNIQSLAAAQEEDVLALWAGLGYYARGRNLHRAAQLIMAEHGGAFPHTLTELQALPGLGRSTASAILAICEGQRLPILDGNVKRVLSRYHGIHGYPGDKKIETILWQYAEAALPLEREMPAYTQAIMDLGALTCLPKNPQCQQCPVQEDCIAYATEQTAILPTPKPKKIIPTKQAWFVIAKNKDRVLLEKRPSKGIWGGLWCLPEFTLKTSLNAFVQNHPLTILEPRPHQFTHYRLILNPCLIHVDQSFCHDKNQHWISLKQLDQYGLPAPILTLLSGQICK
jgi:A/G-specific adenine glycosylase